MDIKKRNEMILRTIIGLILVPLSIALTLYNNKLIFSAIILIIIFLGSRELIKLVKVNHNYLNPIIVYTSAFVIPALLYFNAFTILALYLFLLLFVLFLLKMFSAEPTKNVIDEVAVSFLVSAMLPLFLSTLFMILEFSPYWVLYLCFVVWATDTFAYFTGMAFGKRKLIEKVSPKKSVEGLIGGAVGALIIGLLFNYLFLDKSIFWVTIITIDIIAVAVIGDLIESMIKRSSSIKDSGNLIPGHGGILDRFDSLIFASPVLFFYLTFLSGKYI